MDFIIEKMKGRNNEIGLRIMRSNVLQFLVATDLAMTWH